MSSPLCVPCEVNYEWEKIHCVACEFEILKAENARLQEALSLALKNGTKCYSSGDLCKIRPEHRCESCEALSSIRALGVLDA